MTEQNRQRIKKEANEWVDYNSGGAFHLVPSQSESYIAGATRENERMAELLKEERNKAIDECLEIIAYERQQYVSGATLVVNILVPIRERIESLKSQ